MQNSEPNKISLQELIQRLEWYRNQSLVQDHQEENVDELKHDEGEGSDEEEEPQVADSEEEEEGPMKKQHINSEIQFLFNASQFMISNRLKKKDGEKVKLLIQAMKNPDSDEASPFIFPLAQSRKLQKNIIKNFGAQLLNQCLSDFISKPHLKSHTSSEPSMKKNGKMEEHGSEENPSADEEQEETEIVNKHDSSVHSGNIYHNAQEGNKIEVDIHHLYQQSVQSSRDDVNLFEKMFKTYFQQKAPHVFREDFCGTGLLCCEWAKRGVENISIGIDLDHDTIQWGRKHNMETKYSKFNVSDRIYTFTKNVLEFNWEEELRDCELLLAQDEDTGKCYLRKADIICAYNYSVCLLHKRKDLILYFKKVRESMADYGSIFLLDLLGGAKMLSVNDRERVRKDLPGGIMYEFEQTSYNPITDILTCHIHFKLSDHWIKKAFSYQFRKWGVRELKEALDEAGFSKVELYWASHDRDEDNHDVSGSLQFEKVKNIEKIGQSGSWTALFCCLK
ncbi:hypothetical protein C9374_009978 [Naegleria lovaniensis]|uniref:Methyltransferase domain-containing protein n=1 Tax=Naegleria lovaniensis TaxID=51637 RepID=A0AA88GH32_NAELO|nr:uncharacterized protein C9374_009978 [Naegleria lovaniensis]KAG2375355.1 hypothetical protein C9374_009978 [Naegleria lovaniensis]